MATTRQPSDLVFHSIHVYTYYVNHVLTGLNEPRTLYNNVSSMDQALLSTLRTPTEHITPTSMVCSASTHVGVLSLTPLRGPIVATEWNCNA